MKILTKALAVFAVVACVGSAMAITQTQEIWVSDSSGGISAVPITSTTGNVIYSGSDSFWSIVVTTGTAYPPTLGQGSINAPVMDIDIQATSTGIANANLHPLTVTFGASGFGPTLGTFLASFGGTPVSGSPQTLTFNTFYSSANSMPATTALTSSGSLSSPFPSSVVSAYVNLGNPYSLAEVVTIQAIADGHGATYSLDGSLVGQVPDGGVTAILLGAAFSVLALIRRKTA